MDQHAHAVIGVVLLCIALIVLLHACFGFPFLSQRHKNIRKHIGFPAYLASQLVGAVVLLMMAAYFLHRALVF